MFRNVLLKDIFREIKGSLNRFLSIFAIVMLGVGFFAGVKSTSPDMKITADKYFNDYKLMDIHVMSTIGLDSEDVKAIKDTKSFDNIMFSYSTDAIMNVNNSKAVVKMMSIPETGEGIGSPLNMPILSSGRMPEKSGECLVENNSIQKQYSFKLGDRIKLDPEAGSMQLSDLVKKSEYTVVGFVDMPVYISFMRGTSSLGDGTVSCYMLIPPEDFNLSVYTDAYMTANTARNYSSFDKEYKDEISKLQKSLENIGISRSDVKYSDIKGEISTKINDNRTKIDEAKDGLEELKSQEEKLKSKIEELQAQGKDILAQIPKLQSLEKQLNTKKRELFAQDKQLQSQIPQLQANESQIKSKLQELKDQEKQLQPQLQQLEEQDKQLQLKLKQLEEQDKQLQLQIKQLEEQEAQLQSQINLLQQQIQKANAEGNSAAAQQAIGQVNAASAQLAGIQDKLKEARDGASKLKSSKSELTTQQAAMQPKLKEARDGASKLKTAQSELNTQLTTLQSKIKEAQQGAVKIKTSQSEITAQLNTIQSKIKEAELGAEKIKTAENELKDNLPELQEKITEVQNGIDEGETTLDNAQNELDELEKPKWYIQTREDNPGYTELEQSADRLAAVASVFPVFFLLVAALVCLTTMSRMVEEQRTQLGTLKALGYSNMQIIGKYLIYSGLASLLGSILGIAIGMRFFPRIIFNAYQDMFILPTLIITFQWTYAVASTAAAIICTVCVALFVCNKELKNAPAALMRPKAPKPGKRIVLEHIPFIWSRMGFTSKVTARNLLRYKARFLMTVIGIAGCGALILSGLGLDNSIKTIVPSQFGEIYSYNTLISLKDNAAGEEFQNVKRELASDKNINQSVLVQCTIMDAVKGSEKLQIYLFVPEKPVELANYITLRHRKDKAPVVLEDEGIILTEKASNMLGVSRGDTLELQRKDTKIAVRVSGIVENYVNHNIYMSPKLYKEKFSDNPIFNTVLVKLKDTGEESQKQFSTDWLDKGNTLAVTFTTDLNKDLTDTFNSLNIMVLVMIVSAGCLAFVVLYNLTNINITERIREIATIKVLGFYNGEVANYIYRENIVLTIIGVVLGLVSGIFLHRFIIVMGEVDIVMFGRTILPKSFITAGALTILFSLFVNFVMFFKLKNVSMVESFKTVD